MYNRDHSHLDVYNLERYDLGKEFLILSSNKSCEHKDVTGKMSGWFDWVAQSTYAGKHKVRHMLLDFWVFSAGGVDLGVGVDPKDITRPVLFGMNSTDGSEVGILFEKYFPEIHNPHVFDVPTACE